MKTATMTPDSVVVTEQVIEAPARGLGALVRRTQEYRARRAISRELNGLSDDLLADVGIHRGEIPFVAAQAARRQR